MTLVIGLTGGICSGKSTATIFLQRKYDAIIIDADKLGHEAYKPGSEGFVQIVRHFGESVVTPDGTIDRRTLGSIVFADKQKMDELQAIVWPCIRSMIVERLAEYRTSEIPLVVLEAAVMIEAGWEDLVDSLWVINVDPSIAIGRLQERSGLSLEECQKRLDAQISNDVRSLRASYILSNLINKEAFENEIMRAYEHTLSK